MIVKKAVVPKKNLFQSKTVGNTSPDLMVKHRSAKPVKLDKCSGVDRDEQNFTAGMHRILEQYKSGTYIAEDYSTRTEQRHRKIFLKFGIDLRKPYKPVLPGLSGGLKTRPKTSAKPLGKKKMMRIIKPVSVGKVFRRNALQIGTKKLGRSKE